MKSLEWLGDRLRLIDQTKLPLEELYVDTLDYRVVAEAIRTLKIRGAPAIGIAAAYGMALAALESGGDSIEVLVRDVRRAADELASTRPTAVNLFRALDRMRAILREAESA